MSIWFPLRRAFWLTVVALPLIAADHAPAQRTLKTYPLPSRLLAADISPDETKVAAIILGENRLKVWDFQTGTLVAETELPPWTLEAGVSQVSYSAQGDLLVVCVGRVLQALRASDLKEVRQIVIPDEISPVWYQGEHKPSDGHTFVKSVQLSPVAHVAAVLVGHLGLGDRVDIYDLQTGAKMKSWILGPTFAWFAWIQAWHPDGRRVFVVTGDISRNRREIVELDIATGVPTVRLSVARPVSSIAVTSEHLLMVDNRDMGLLVAHDPTLQVFDLVSWKMVHELGGRGSGVRHHLSVSRDGRRLVAFTGKQRICVDLDGWGSCSVDQTFSVWDLKTYAGIATSQSLEGLVGGLFSISPAGHFVVITGGFRSQVVEVP